MTDAQPIDLNKKTVFILGAGASKPYGFPLGTELKDIMATRLSNTTFQNSLIKHGLDSTLINDFAEALPRTYHPTIDIFLEKKRRFRDVGAYVIAYSILHQENSLTLFPQKNWYAHLYNLIKFEEKLPNTENIDFVTLNYDRSLEHFLNRNIHYNCPDHLIQIAESKLERLRIIHAHGSLGSYPHIGYGADLNNWDVIHQAAECIRLITDRIEDSNDFQEALSVITEAINIVFIGFGYDPTTLKLLTQGIDFSKKRIIGTTYKIQQSTRDYLENYFKGYFEFGGGDISAESFIKTFLPIT